MSRFITHTGLLAVLALHLSACDDKGSDAPKAAGGPTAKSVDKPGPTGACDVTVKIGAAAPAVAVEAGKTYCVGDLRFTRDTKIDDARKMLSDCRPDEVLEGETRVPCKGVQLSFGGPVLILSKIQPTAP